MEVVGFNVQMGLLLVVMFIIYISQIVLLHIGDGNVS